MQTILMKYVIIFALILAPVNGNLPEDPAEYMKWESESIAAIEAQMVKDPEVAIPKLGSWVVKLSTGMNFEKGERPVFSAAQAALLSIPGHAKYYQDKIEKMRNELLEHSKKSALERIRMQEDGIKMIDEPNYLSDAEVALRTLKFMPSAETVSVLGHFLNDPVGRDGKSLLGTPLKTPGADHGPRVSHAGVATEIIRALGIESPPFRDTKGVITPEEIDAWKDWWNEVKDGKRTYRFIGSQIEYGPDGPAAQKVIQRVERDQKRDGEGKAGLRKSSAVTDAGSSADSAAKPLAIAGIFAACALIGGAVWYFLRSRSKV